MLITFLKDWDGVNDDSVYRRGDVCSHQCLDVEEVILLAEDQFIRHIEKNLHDVRLAVDRHLPDEKTVSELNEMLLFFAKRAKLGGVHHAN